MKAFFISAITLISFANSATVLAASSPAVRTTAADSRFLTFEERTLICEAVEQYTEVSGTEFVLDRRQCLNAAPMQADLLGTINTIETYLVSGTFKFTAPDKASYDSQCSVIYVSGEQAGTLVNGSAIQVNCK